MPLDIIVEQQRRTFGTFQKKFLVALLSRTAGSSVQIQNEAVTRCKQVGLVAEVAENEAEKFHPMTA